MSKKHIITTTREALLDALSIPARITPKKSPIEAYQRVTLSNADGGEVRVFASDGMMSADVHMAAECKGKRFSVCVPGRDFFDVARRCGASEVEIEVHGENKVIVKSGGSRWTLPATDADNAPLPVEAGSGETTEIKVSADTLAWLLGSVRHASGDAAKAHLCGALLHYVTGKGEQLRAVATDGHRVALAASREATCAKEARAFLPVPTVELLAAALPGRGDLVLRVGGRTLEIDAGPLSMGMMLADDAFPPYTKVMPTTSAHTLSIDGASMAAEVKRTVMDRSGNMSLFLGPERLRMAWSDPDGRSGEGGIDCDCPGADLHIGVSSAYLVDALGLSVATPAKTTVGFTGPLDPILLRTAGEGCETTTVVMPVRV